MKAQKHTILVVDDDETTRFLMSEFLNLLGYGCILAKDGLDCLAKLGHSPRMCTLILMDVHMPQVNGLEVSRSIRALEADPPATLPIIAVTADSAYHSAAAVRAYGIDDVLPKPVDLRQLKLLLARFTGGAVRPV